MIWTPEEVASRIIWSADVADEVVLLDRVVDVEKLRVKVDRAFTERVTQLRDRDGRRVMLELKERGLEVFYDAKFVEIPSKLEELAQGAMFYKPWMVNCMAGCISNGVIEALKRDELDGLKRFADVCLKAGSRPCAVTVLTSKSDTIVADEFNDRSSIEQVLYYVGQMQRCGFTDVVCSPLEAAAIRADSQFDKMDVNTPGIQRPNADATDQARTDTLAGALQGGVTTGIIGRALTNGNLRENFDAIVAETVAELARAG